MSYRALLSCCYLLALQSVAAWGQEPPKGEVLKFSFEQSKIFPGTYREYSIYIPRQDSPNKPACVHINQDGVGAFPFLRSGCLGEAVGADGAVRPRSLPVG